MRRIALAALLALTACAPPYTRTDVRVLDKFQLVSVPAGQMEGLWYVVASFPGPHQEGCSHATFEFRALADGKLGVAERCMQNGRMVALLGEATSSRGGAYLASFEGFPFVKEYLVLGDFTDGGGRTLLIGTPARLSGWVLHSDRRITPQQMDRVHEIFARNSYDTAALERMNQR